MTTQNSSYSRILAVWLVFFVFLVGMILPSPVHAKREMTIGSEGDPGDGMDFAGGGGGDNDGNGNLTVPNYFPDHFVQFRSFPSQEGPMISVRGYHLFWVPFWGNGQIQILVFPQSWDRGAIR